MQLCTLLSTYLTGQMTKWRARQAESLHVSSAFAHHCTHTIALANVKVVLKSPEHRLAAQVCNCDLPGPGLQHLHFAFLELRATFFTWHKIKSYQGLKKLMHQGMFFLFSRSLRVLSFKSSPSQQADTRFSAPLAPQRRSPPSFPVPRRSLWRRGCAPQALPALRLPPGRGGQLYPQPVPAR